MVSATLAEERGYYQHRMEQRISAAGHCALTTPGSTVHGTFGSIRRSITVKVRVRFDGPPGPVSGRFIEVEDSGTGCSISLGEWFQDPTSNDWFLSFELGHNDIEICQQNVKRLTLE